jgi:hypothetical protein
LKMHTYKNLQVLHLIVLVFLFCFCSVGDWTQGLVNARQVFYQWATPLAPE